MGRACDRRGLRRSHVGTLLLPRDWCRCVRRVGSGPYTASNHDLGPRLRHLAEEPRGTRPCSALRGGSTRSPDRMEDLLRPKSMTVLNQSSSTRRFLQAMSPWNQTGEPCHIAARAASHKAPPAVGIDLA